MRHPQIAVAALLAATLGYDANDLRAIHEITDTHDAFEFDSQSDDFTLINTDSWEFIEWS